MKVSELQEHLSKIDPDLEVLCYCEDEKLLSGKRGFILLDVSDVVTATAKRLRLEDGTPYLKFEQGPEAVVIATLNVTSDF